MGDDQAGPVAIRNYPEGSPMLLLPEEHVRLAVEQIRSWRSRRLIEDNNDVDNDGSQGD
jgi:hypothetical protein